MDQLEPGDLVRHTSNREEGRYLRPVVWCVGTNKGEGHLVDVSGKEKMWLETETEFLERPTQKLPPESAKA